MTLLLVHGLIGHMRGAEMERAMGGSRFAPDLLGYGELRDTRGTLDMEAQVEHLYAFARSHGIERAHVVGHSVGGALAMLLARRYPSLVESIVNVEGNFTLKDAFWSHRIARMEVPEVDSMLRENLAHPQAWLEQSGVAPTEQRVSAALSHLKNQPAATVRAVARSIVEVTERPCYLDEVRAVMDAGVPIHLIAGERSRPAWDVPEFVLAKARSLTVLPETGHLVTIESPVAFGAAVRACIAA